MRAFETSLIYGLIGVAVATALVLREERPRLRKSVFLFCGGTVFWPLFAPLLLGGPRASGSGPSRLTNTFEVRIRGAEEQLLAALSKLHGVAQEVLTPEIARVGHLAGALKSMATRLHEIDELLRAPEFDPVSAQAAITGLVSRGVSNDDPRVESVRARLRNIERLESMRHRTADDLERALLKIEEMSSQMLLLKFAGRPDAEVVQVIKDIAQSVGEVTEGLLAAG
jgi:hypothetical protein